MTAKSTEKYSPAKLHADLKKGIVAPLYLFFGQEDFLIDQWINLVRPNADWLLSRIFII